MRSAALVAVLVLAASGCGGSGDGATPATPGAGEPAALAGITTAHNQVRAVVGVGPLGWDPALASIASAWAAQCVDADASGLLDHNPGRSVGYPTYVGENIYGTTGSATAQGAVDLWAAEKADYDYATNTCAAGKVCGHYTQIVWAATTKVGCARSDCPNLLYRSTVVCNYGPGGNISGQRPY